MEIACLAVHLRPSWVETVTWSLQSMFLTFAFSTIHASPSGTVSRTIASIKRVNPRGCWSVTNQSSGRLPQGSDASNHPSTRAQNHRIVRERSSPLVHLPARNGTALQRIRQKKEGTDVDVRRHRPLGSIALLGVHVEVLEE